MPSEPRPRGRVVTLLTWLGRALLALVFLGAGASKLVGEPAMVTMFADISAGQWLRYAVGGLEVLGAVGVLVPATSALAAVGLALLMVGATATNLTVLGASPWLPLLLLVLAGLVARAGREPLLRSRLTPTGS